MVAERCDRLAMFISLLFGILDGSKDLHSAYLTVLARSPLAEQGLAWLMPTVVMVVLAIIGHRAAGRQVTSSAHEITEHLFNHGGCDARGFLLC
ncbi:branched-chain amino acid transport system II carrier protein [Shigella flexneri]